MTRQLRLDGDQRRRPGRHERRIDALVRRARAEGALDALDDGEVVALRALAVQLDMCEATGNPGTGAYVARELRETLRAAQLTRDTRPTVDDGWDALVESLNAGAGVQHPPAP